MEELEMSSITINKNQESEIDSISDSATVNPSENNKATNPALNKELSLLDFETIIGKNFYQEEVWETQLSFDARIHKICKDIVTCECILDSDDKIFETRDYPSILFKHIKKLQKNHPIIIKISSKPGATKIEIFNGIGIVDTTIFEIKNDWSKLENSDLDNVNKSYQYD